MSQIVELLHKQKKTLIHSFTKPIVHSANRLASLLIIAYFVGKTIGLNKVSDVSRLKITLLFLWISLSFITFGQQPSHFFIGKQEFANSKVYSLLMSSNNQLYAATNYGLSVYRNGTFHKVKSTSSQHGSSLFSLTENDKGEIFCCNLAGQIFKVEAEELELFLTIPDEYLSENIELSFDSNDNLILRSRGCYRWRQNIWETIYHSNEGSSPTLNSFDNSQILIPAYSSDSLLKIGPNSIQTIFIDLSTPDLKEISPYYPTIFSGDLFSFHRDGILINHSKQTVINRGDLDTRVFQQVGNNEIWALEKTTGARKIVNENGVINVSKLLIPNYFISALTKSKNGTIYLGTFDRGIIVIPSMSSLIVPSKDVFCTGLCPTENGLMVIDQAGSIFDVSENSVELFKEKASYARGKLMCVAGINFNILDRRKSLLFNSPEKGSTGSIGLVKDVTKVDDNTAIIATTRGIFRLGAGANQFKWLTMKYDASWTSMTTKRFRCRTVAYDIQNSSLYYATQSQIIHIDKNGVSQPLTYKGNSIDCNQLIYETGVVWCSSQSYGVLKIVNGEIVDIFDTSNGLRSNYIRKVQRHGTELYISHKKGFQIINLRTKKVESIGTAEGITNGSISDFVVSGKKLWVISNGQVIALPLNKLEKDVDFSLVIPFVRLGDSLLSKNLKPNLSYDQNHLLVSFDFRGIEFESEAVIQYRLKGLNDTWKHLKSTRKTLEFNALAPGNYQFDVRVRYRNIESEVQTYSFTIASPFWQTWWFYSLIVLSTAGIVIVFYRIRLKKAKVEQTRLLDKQKMQTQMFDSELKALRSQMNPHFIFNSLNSIQNLVLNEERERSYDYIVLFAKLVRNTLNYSNAGFIPINDELEFLDIYLSLEQLRFGDKFQYQINYEGTKDIFVPSMLIQPFIENALVHGLIHVKGIKKLDISFKRSNELICTIIDNGVGRDKAREIARRQKTNHASFALNAIEQRMELLNAQLGTEVGKFEIIDLFENEKSIGTKVIITIPFRLDPTQLSTDRK